ncbi:MAG: hypothetical protein ABF536_09145 [Liquorilactobacillus mali]
MRAEQHIGYWTPKYLKRYLVRWQYYDYHILEIKNNLQSDELFKNVREFYIRLSYLTDEERNILKKNFYNDDSPRRVVDKVREIVLKMSVHQEYSSKIEVRFFDELFGGFKNKLESLAEDELAILKRLCYELSLSEKALANAEKIDVKEYRIKLKGIFNKIMR